MFRNKEGQQVPAVTFRTRTDSAWLDVTSEEIFKGRTVVVFALPGAFTPTCSSSHVPRYNQLAPLLKAAGVDEIICVAVNDAFVMNEWQASQKASRLRFLPDGNGEFAAGMGMLLSKAELGFGLRSWRYSMLVRDRVIEKMFIEPDQAGDPFVNSDADTMLKWLAPDAAPPPSVTLFTRSGCPHCANAKRELAGAGIDYEELVLNRDFGDQTLRAISPILTYPRIFIDGTLIGGAAELSIWLETAHYLVQSKTSAGLQTENPVLPAQNNGKIMKGGVTA